MRRLVLFCLSLMVYVTSGAQIRGNSVTVTVTPDHKDWNYRVGEQCGFIVNVLRSGTLIDNVKVDYEAGPEMYPEVKKKGVVLKDGTLTLKAGDEGKSNGATFEGSITYTGDAPEGTTEIKATLVGSSNVGVQITDGKVTGVSYPLDAYCDDVADAVQKYSNLTGTSTYSSKSFTLTQQTAFLNFVITFEDGTTTGTGLSAVVSNNSAAVCTANVTTTTESEKVVAKFVLPVAKGTTLSSANVKMGSKAAISFGASQTLDGKVYNVKKTQAAAYTMAAAATSADKGKLICADGHIHANGADAACTKARVAKIIYIGTTGHATYSHGLALALTDEGQMAWQAAIDACSAKNTSTPVTGATWLLASEDQWNYMLDTNGAGSYTALRDGFSGITGASNLHNDYYWSRTELNSSYALLYNFRNGGWSNDEKGEPYRVRACLAF